MTIKQEIKWRVHCFIFNVHNLRCKVAYKAAKFAFEHKLYKLQKGLVWHYAKLVDRKFKYVEWSNKFVNEIGA